MKFVTPRFVNTFFLEMKMQNLFLTMIYFTTLTGPLRRKLRMTWFFDVYKVEEWSFSKSDLTEPLRFFFCSLFFRII